MKKPIGPDILKQFNELSAFFENPSTAKVVLINAYESGNSKLLDSSTGNLIVSFMEEQKRSARERNSRNQRSHAYMLSNALAGGH